MTDVSSEEVWDALDDHYGEDGWTIKHTISAGERAVRLKVGIGHMETESHIEADFYNEHFVTEETREVLYEKGEGITETIPWENRKK